MRFLSLPALAVLLFGCASAGVFPSSAGDPSAASSVAQRQISLAEEAGADSLAPDPLGIARRQLADAQAQAQAGRSARASVSAQQAAASAIFAKSEADRVRSERDKAIALAALQALPPQER